jgi:hypothetical protein
MQRPKPSPTIIIPSGFHYIPANEGGILYGFDLEFSQAAISAAIANLSDTNVLLFSQEMSQVKVPGGV